MDCFAATSRYLNVAFGINTSARIESYNQIFATWQAQIDADRLQSVTNAIGPHMYEHGKTVQQTILREEEQTKFYAKQLKEHRFNTWDIGTQFNALVRPLDLGRDFNVVINHNLGFGPH